jgi:hypothetical protein
MFFTIVLNELVDDIIFPQSGHLTIQENMKNFNIGLNFFYNFKFKHKKCPPFQKENILVLFWVLIL